MGDEHEAIGPDVPLRRVLDTEEGAPYQDGTPEDLAVYNACQDMEIMLESTPDVDGSRDRIVSRIMGHVRVIPKTARAKFIADYWPGTPPIVDEDGIPVRENNRLRLL